MSLTNKLKAISRGNPNDEFNLTELMLALTLIASAVDSMTEGVEDALGNGGLVGSDTVTVTYDDAENTLAIEVTDDSITNAKLTQFAKRGTQALDIDSITVTPDGSNHADLTSVLGFSAPIGGYAKLVAAVVYCSTPIAAGDATNKYQFKIVTSAGLAMNSYVPDSVSGITAGTGVLITLNQNNYLDEGGKAFLRITQLDDGGSGPTDISTAKMRVVFTYELVDSLPS